MGHKIKVNRYVRRRPLSPRMKEILEHMGVKMEVTVQPHERAYTPRRRPKKDEDKGKDREG